MSRVVYRTAMMTIGKGENVAQHKSSFFEELAGHWPELDGFDQHFQATIHFPLTSAAD